ncbi:glutathione S-transferase N-terminal domain-containing protein [Agarilytica rhodophyticola]|uniref:glutathione S-transferase N-terminal domain-containing protein n=1 Tax=Agarilytica rhodophyticola TaxID=1737490 RepID=UPI000B34203F|nr:glutathione S-transferase N-terminal domain-containing protein [Agarilytica rhodophyticola]
MNKQPIDLYFWPTPNGFKISILLEELHIPYNVQLVNILKGEQFEDDFLKISPNGRMPAIIDPDGPNGQAISVFESGAIMQYLANKYDQFYTSDERKRTEVNEWLFWQMGGLGPMGGQAIHFYDYASEKIPYAIDRYLGEYNRLLNVMDKHLEGREYLADEYSIADMACIGWIKASEILDVSLDRYSHVQAWFDKLCKREAVQRGFNLANDRYNERDRIANDKEARKNLFQKNGLP